MISSICHRELFVFYCGIDTRVVPRGNRKKDSFWGMLSHFWWQHCSVTDNHWWLTQQCIFNDTSMMLLGTFGIFLPPRYFFVTSDFQRCIFKVHTSDQWVQIRFFMKYLYLCHDVWNMLHFRRSPFCLWAFLWGWDTCDGWKWACVSCVSRLSCASRVS